MAILVNGGAGYIGRPTCIELMKAGYEIIVADNLYNSCEEALRRVEQISGKKVPFVNVDLCDGEAVDALFASHPEIDAVIHFAAYKAVGESVQKPLEYYTNNLGCTLTVLNAMRKYNVKNFVFSSSATVYGDPASVPITEDFPTGATILGHKGIEQAYRTGRGLITMRAVVNTEEINGRMCLVVTELPYQVNPDRLVVSIREAVRDGKIQGIADMRDETSGRTGQRLVLVLKRDAVPKVVLNNLYKHSQLQQTFGANMLALVDGVPRTLSLDAFIRHWVNHQLDVIARRTAYLKREAEERDHILQGYLKALDMLDEVIALIRASEDTDTARTGLMGLLDIDQVQADAILAMQLRTLTRMNRDKIVAEHEELQRKIADYIDILAKPERQRKIIGDELDDEELHALLQASAKHRAEEKALYLLEHRAHSKKELENKITRAEFDREAARSAVEHMEEFGLLNDEDYARRLANELFTRKKFGARRVKQELRQKGIDDALIAAVMDEFSTERSETEENIRAILERKYPMAREDEKVRRRAVAALQRYGYGFDEIFSVLNSEE